MKADAEDFRRQYSGLNDEGLLAIDRDELVPMAQLCYDAELAARGLKAHGGQPEEDEAAAPQKALENLVEIAAFDNPSEAAVVRSLLRTAEIPCALSTDLPAAGSVFDAAQDVGLYVPSEYVDEANAVLDSQLSDEDLAAQAEAAGLEEEDGEESAEEDEFEPEV